MNWETGIIQLGRELRELSSVLCVGLDEWNGEGREGQRKGMYRYTWLSCFNVLKKQIQLCKATISQLNNNNNKRHSYLISHLVFTIIWKSLENSVRKHRKTTGIKIGKRKKNSDEVIVYIK